MSDKKARQARRRQKAAAPDPKRQYDAPTEHEHGGAAKPISLHPLDFDTAVRGLTGVKWPQDKKR